jgi:hypothetical protein
MKKGMKKCEVLTNYQSAEFKQALEVLDACAAEGWFDGELDCHHCPARKSCLKFWDDFIVNLDSLSSGASENLKNFRGKKSDHYLETVAPKFNQLLDKKHGYEDNWIEKLLPISSRQCEPFAPRHCEPKLRAKGVADSEAISRGVAPLLSCHSESKPRAKRKGLRGMRVQGAK